MKPVTAIALAILALLVFVAFQVNGLEHSLERHTEPVTLTGAIKMAPDYSTSWESSRGMETVNTTCDGNETAEHCLNRHNERVEAAQELNPPVQ